MGLAQLMAAVYTVHPSVLFEARAGLVNSQASVVNI